MVTRIDHAFETIRTEFDSIQGEVHTLRAQRDELESKGAFSICFLTSIGTFLDSESPWKVRFAGDTTRIGAPFQS